MKKAEKKLESAQRSAKSARERVQEVALGAAVGGGLGAMFGDDLVAKLPGNSAAEVAEMAAKKKGPSANKRVQWAAGAVVATVIFGSKDMFWAAGTGLATSALTLAVAAHKSATGGLNVAALAYDGKKG